MKEILKYECPDFSFLLVELSLHPSKEHKQQLIPKISTERTPFFFFWDEHGFIKNGRAGLCIKRRENLKQRFKTQLSLSQLG